MKLNMRIAIAEDDKPTLRGLTELLEILGHEVVQYEDGLQLVKLANTYRPDLILLDMMMPNFTGWEVLDFFEKAINENYRKIPVFVITAISKDEREKLAGRKQVRQVFSKPLDLDRLIDALRTLSAESR